MKTLNHSQLIEKIAKTKGMTIVGLQTFSDARAKKTGNPFGTIFKQVRSVGLVGADYEKGVNREMARQGVSGEFQAETLPWGTWLVNGKIIEHKGKHYLRTQSAPGIRRKQPAKVLNYRNSAGEFLSKNQIEPFLPETKESTKQQDKGLEETVWVRTWSFDSIQKIRIGGETYEVKQG